ncbi:hypothetical protein [Myxococcus phage Mx1]|nr:hypothetical protein [Myxococcus phage Mx1]
MTDELARRPEEEDFTAVERDAYQKWKRGPDTTPLSPTVAVKMYQLFLAGHTCEEISRINENRFPLGLILHSRIRFEWDRRRDEYLGHLFDDVAGVMRQRQVESALFLADLLAVAHREYGDKLKKYLQTGDEKDLPKNFKITSITMYKMTVDALMKVTGQDKPKSDGQPLVQIHAQNVGVSDGKEKTLDGQSAHSLLELLDMAEKKSKEK